jgi:hypothetical protein
MMMTQWAEGILLSIALGLETSARLPLSIALEPETLLVYCSSHLAFVLRP